jgi:hypothetical protein
LALSARELAPRQSRLLDVRAFGALLSLMFWSSWGGVGVACCG